MAELKIKVGNRYRTRDGREALITHVMHWKAEERPEGVVDGKFNRTWFPNGRLNTKEELPLDLVADLQTEVAENAVGGMTVRDLRIKLADLEAEGHGDLRILWMTYPRWLTNSVQIVEYPDETFVYVGCAAVRD